MTASIHRGVTCSNTQFRGLGDTTTGPVPAGGIAGTATFNNAELNVKYPITPPFLVGAAEVYTKNSGADGQNGAHDNPASFRADDFLSTRTDVYFVGKYQRASGTDSSGRNKVSALSTT